METTTGSELTVKITGFQWRWKYEYVEDDLNFISSLDPESNDARQLELGEDPAIVDNQLLQVDNHKVLPADTKIKFLITADDVIHSWWVPDLAIKNRVPKSTLYTSLDYTTTPYTDGDSIGGNADKAMALAKAALSDPIDLAELARFAVRSGAGRVDLARRARRIVIRWPGAAIERCVLESLAIAMAMSGDLVGAERRTVGFFRTLHVRRALADDGACADQCRAVQVRAGRGDGADPDLDRFGDRDHHDLPGADRQDDADRRPRWHRH